MFSAIASIVPSLINDMRAQDNIKDARKWQEKQYENQKQFWYEQQEYNSPVNQVKRIKEAGLNPQFMLGGIQSGQMGSSPSVGTPTAAQTADYADSVQNFVAFQNMKTQQRMAEAQVQDVNADATLKQIDAFTRLSENLLRLKELGSGINRRAVQNIVDMYNASLNGVSVGIQGRLAQSNIDMNEQRMENMVIERMIAEENLKWLPQEKKMQIKNLATEIALKIANKQLTLEQAKKIWYESNYLWYDAESKRIDNELKEDTFDNLVLKSYYDVFRTDSPWALIGGFTQSGVLLKDKFNGKYVPYYNRQRER